MKVENPTVKSEEKGKLRYYVLYAKGLHVQYAYFSDDQRGKPLSCKEEME